MADVRDFGAALYHVAKGKKGAWVDLAAAGIGFIPIAGDGVKQVIKHRDEIKALARAGGAVVENLAEESSNLRRLGARQRLEASLGRSERSGRMQELAEANALRRADERFSSLPDAFEVPGRGLGAAEVPTRASRLRNAAGLGLPHKEGYIRFVPDSRWNPNRALQRGPQGGFMDRHGNEWKPDFIKGEWDVQLGRQGQRQLGHLSKNGRYLKVTPDGRIIH